jgi:hypothetical protein
MVSDDEWNKLQRENFLKGIHHHFSVYPNTMYRPSTEDSTGVVPEAKIDTPDLMVDSIKDDINVHMPVVDIDFLLLF